MTEPFGENQQPSLPSQPSFQERNPGRNSGAWIGGLVLIALGLVFLFQNFTGFALNNWWALFILIPAFGSLGNAWSQYRQSGGWTDAVRGSLIGGMILLFIALVFLLNLDFAKIWPMFLVFAGLSALISGLMKK